MKVALPSVLLLTFFVFVPITAYAEILIDNQTDHYMTAYLKSSKKSPCSSEAKQRGIVPPHGTLKIPQTIIATYCGFSDCSAHVFMNNNCNAPEGGIATVSSMSGISDFKNEDSHYNVYWSAYKVTVKPVGEHNLKSWLKSLFF